MLNKRLSNDTHISLTAEKMIETAEILHVSDIHLEPSIKSYVIRFRQNGFLNEQTELENETAARLIAHLKIMANLNIAEKRLPQDGYIAYMGKNKLNIRMSTCLTHLGEKIVLRLQEKTADTLHLNNLGLPDRGHAIIQKWLQQSQGLLIVTGPTGSGKSITLYSTLQTLNTKEKNIITIEDPIEITLPGINQLQIQRSIQLDFQHLLRASLRQDPDVIMIGEIRDQETAHTAIQAAETGHLVLTTLHTRNVLQTMARLAHFNLEKEKFIQPGTLLIAQRLVRKLCEHCKKRIADTYQAIGCDVCEAGYNGRTGLFELLFVTEKNQLTILQNKLMSHHYLSFSVHATELTESGTTTKQEITRVLS